MNVSMFIQLTLSGLSMGAVYALIGVGYMTVFKASGVINMAQGEAVMLGGLITGFFFNTLGLPYWLSILIAIAMTIVYGILSGLLFSEVLRKVSGFGLLVAGLGLSTLTSNGARILFGVNPFSLPPIVGKMGGISIFGASTSAQNILIFAVLLLIFLGLQFLQKKTVIGKGMEAVATDLEGAYSVGIPKGPVVILAFIISSGIGAVGGVLISPIIYTSYATGMTVGIKGFIAGILGGWGSIPGAIFGGLIVGVFEALFTAFVPVGYKDALPFLILIIILYAMPRGLTNSKALDYFS